MKISLRIQISFIQHSYHYSLFLHGCCSEKIIVVVLWQLFQIIPHLSFPFQSSRSGSYLNSIFLNSIFFLT